MIKTLLFPLLVACMSLSAGASTVDFSATGMFSSTATAASPFVVPGDAFDLSFVVSTTPTPISSSPLSVDVSISSFTYTLNGIPVSLTSPNTPPTDVTFDTLVDGGGFEVDFPTVEFLFSGAQMFTGSTTDPIFSVGSFSNTSWQLLGASNAPSGTGPVTVTPEPSALPVLLSGCLIVLAFRARKFVQAR